MRDGCKTAEEQMLLTLQKEKEELSLILKRIQDASDAAENALVEMREEKAAFEAEEAARQQETEALLSERALRSLAERELSSLKERMSFLEEENAALLSDKQTLLKKLLNK